MSRFHVQEGLEVVEVPPGLEPADTLREKEVVVKSHVATGAGKNIAEAEAEAEAHEPTKSRKRWPLWIGLATVAIVAIVAAVVGGVLGSKKSTPHTSDAKLASDDAANSTMLRDKSPLSVTGWYFGGKTHVQLFWQGRDDFVYYSAWDSGHDRWDAPVKLTVGAVPDTPMAAGVIYQAPTQDGGPPDPQVQFFYQNTSGYLSGENFRSSFPEGLPDSINNEGYAFEMKKDSTLAAYWPLIVHGSLRLETVWYSPGTGYLSSPKSLSAESVIGSVKTPMAVLPLQRMHPTNNLTVKSDIKLLYRRGDGYLYEFDRWSNGTVTKNNQLKGFEIAPNGTLAAFATARDKTSSLLNTYLIYQASDGRIMYGTDTHSSGWEGPKTDVVFDGADFPTNLACVTMAAGTNPDIPLTTATDLNKCYFQRRRRLVEVTYDGTRWSTLATVNIP